MNALEKIQLFRLSMQMTEKELDRVEADLSLDLQRDPVDSKDEEFYPQIERNFRKEGSEMARHYEVFYALEKSIRNLIKETLEERYGPNWWDEPGLIPEPIKNEVQNNIQRELDHAVAPRSDDELDYTTFGQLGDIVRHKWDDFEVFNSKKGFNKVMTSLNVLRGPIAHCCELPRSEIVRLNSTVEDWFRLLS